MGSSSSKSVDSLQFQVVQANFDRLVNAVKPAIGDVARKAFQQSLITQQNLSDAENLMLPEDHRSSVLLRQVLTSIKQNEEHFQTFMFVLKDVPILSNLANEMIYQSASLAGKQAVQIKKNRHKKSEAKDTGACRSPSLSSFHSIRIHQDRPFHSSAAAMSVESESSLRGCSASEIISLSTSVLASCSCHESATISSCAPFQCRCGKNCSLNSFVHGRCNQESREVYPYLKLDHLSMVDREKLVRKLTSETQTIISKFADLVVYTFDSLERQKIGVRKLRANVLIFGQQKLPKPYSDDHIDRLENASNVRDIQIFLVRYKYISFFNYGILEKIIQHYGTDGDKRNLDEYLTSYSHFCKRSVFEVPSTVIKQLAPEIEDQPLVVKVNEELWISRKNRKNEPNYFSLHDLYAVEESIAKIIGLERTYILLCDINEGCIELSFEIVSETVVLPIHPVQLRQMTEKGIEVPDYLFEEQKHLGSISSSAPDLSDNDNQKTEERLEQWDFTDVSVKYKALQKMTLCESKSFNNGLHVPDNDSCNRSGLYGTSNNKSSEFSSLPPLQHTEL